MQPPLQKGQLDLPLKIMSYPQSLTEEEFTRFEVIKSDFYHTELSKEEFDEAVIDQAQFSGTSLPGIDLSTAEFHNLGVILEDLGASK